MECKKCKFNIGDYVKVIDSGKTYSSYTEMADFFGLKNWKKLKSPLDDTIVRILNFHEHLYSKKMYPYESIIVLHVIDESTKQEYIIGQDGVELHKKYEFLDDNDFEI